MEQMTEWMSNRPDKQTDNAILTTMTHEYNNQIDPCAKISQDFTEIPPIESSQYKMVILSIDGFYSTKTKANIKISPTRNKQPMQIPKNWFHWFATSTDK